MHHPRRASTRTRVAATLAAAALLAIITLGCSGDDAPPTGSVQRSTAAPSDPTPDESPFVEAIEEVLLTYDDLSEAEARCIAVGAVRILGAEDLIVRGVDPQSFGTQTSGYRFEPDTMVRGVRDGQQLLLECTDVVEMLANDVERAGGRPEDLQCLRDEADPVEVALLLSLVLLNDGRTPMALLAEVQEADTVFDTCSGAAKALDSQVVFSEVPGAIEPLDD